MPTVMIKILFILFYSSLLFASAQSYTLKLKLDKKELYLGESTHLSLIFSYDNAVEDYELPEIQIKNFKIEELSSSDYELKNGLFVEQIEYKLTPLQRGKFTVDAFQAKVETLTQEYKQLNNRSKFTKKLLIASNKLTVHVKQLPENLSVIGHYTLTADVDKKRIHQGERVTLTITLQGKGNLNNLDALQLNIPDATSYLVMSSKNTKEHLLTKTFEIIGENSYTIAPIVLEYFDKELTIKRVTQTEPISIEIIDTKQKKLPIAKRKKEKTNLLFFLLGVASSLFFVLLFVLFKKRVQKRDTHNPLLTSLKQAGDTASLYKSIVIYLQKDALLDSLIFRLEKRSDSHFKKIKKMIIQRVKEIQLGEP